MPETERTHPLSGWNRPNPGRVHVSYRAVLRGWAFRPIRGDAHLNSRFDPHGLPSWRYDEDFQGLIGSLIRALPLRSPSELGEGALKRILEATGGITSAIFRLITDLAVEAIGSGAERITAPAIFNRRIASPAPEAVL